VAPSAPRIAISRVRRATEYEPAGRTRRHAV